MKKYLLLTLLLVFTLQLSIAQMSVSTVGNVVTFTFDDANDVGQWDANGNPIRLYIYVDAADASNNQFAELAGGWPGTEMTNLGSDIYELEVNLSNFYPDGTTINDIQYIFNNDFGQNPGSGGFSAVAAGYVPTTTLSNQDLARENNAIKFTNGQLYGNNSVYNINIYNVFGQLVKSFNNQNLLTNNGFDLNLNKNELFIVQVKSETTTKVLKVISQ